jgi:hypothetical protein
MNLTRWCQHQKAMAQFYTVLELNNRTEKIVPQVLRHVCHFQAKGNTTLDLPPSWLLTDCEVRRDFLPNGSRYADGTQPSTFNSEMKRKWNVPEHFLERRTYTINTLVWGLAPLLYTKPSSPYSYWVTQGHDPSPVFLHPHQFRMANLLVYHEDGSSRLFQNVTKYLSQYSKWFLCTHNRQFQKFNCQTCHVCLHIKIYPHEMSYYRVLLKYFNIFKF